MTVYFYSHAREGRDVPACQESGIFALISTHTPARGVTPLLVQMVQKLTNFYSHAREGRDAGISEQQK